MLREVNAIQFLNNLNSSNLKSSNNSDQEKFSDFFKSLLDNVDNENLEGNAESKIEIKNDILKELSNKAFLENINNLNFKDISDLEDLSQSFDLVLSLFLLFFDNSKFQNIENNLDNVFDDVTVEKFISLKTVSEKLKVSFENFLKEGNYNLDSNLKTITTDFLKHILPDKKLPNDKNINNILDGLNNVKFSDVLNADEPSLQKLIEVFNVVFKESEKVKSNIEHMNLLKGIVKVNLKEDKSLENTNEIKVNILNNNETEKFILKSKDDLINNENLNLNKKDVLNQVSEKLNFSISENKKDLSFTLKPKELGEVHIKLSFDSNNNLKVNIATSTSEVKNLLLSSMSSLSEALKNYNLQSINIKDVNVFKQDRTDQSFNFNEFSQSFNSFKQQEESFFDKEQNFKSKTNSSEKNINNEEVNENSLKSLESQINRLNVYI